MKNKNLLLLLGGWVVLALVQAGLTDLANDEAYYWMYSRQLDWGYFDHPPVVALMIKIGYSLFQNELGVRLLTVFSQAIALYLIFVYLVTDNHQPKTFFELVVLIPLIHVFSFITFTDGPLLLGTVVFLVLYKSYSEESRWGLVVPLAVTMAFMMYSKYHAALVILLVMFSKPRLWADVKWMAACVLGALLFSPHLWWQYQHEFPSLKYHLVDRNTAFDPKDVVMFVVNQLINFNPLIFGLVFWRMVKSKAQRTDFERALYYVFFGFLSFFLVMTWRGHIEPQWTYVLVVPILYFSVKLFSESDRKIILRSAWLILPLLIAGRIFLVADLLPFPTEFHGYPALVKKIQDTADGRPVVILNSYQLTAKYHFYSGQAAVGMITDGRRNQYSLYRDEEAVLGQPVYLVARREQDGFEKINAGGFYTVWGKAVDSFSYYKDVAIEVAPFGSLRETFGSLRNLNIPLTIENPYRQDLVLSNEVALVLIGLENGRAKEFFPIETDLEVIRSGEKYEVTGRVAVPETMIGRQAVIGIRSEGQFFSINSGVIELSGE